MHTVTVTRLIHAPKENVWSVLDDFGNISAFHPIVESSPIENGIATGKDASRVCHFYDGGGHRRRCWHSKPQISLAGLSLLL